MNVATEIEASTLNELRGKIETADAAYRKIKSDFDGVERRRTFGESFAEALIPLPRSIEANGKGERGSLEACQNIRHFNYSDKAYRRSGARTG